VGLSHTHNQNDVIARSKRFLQLPSQMLSIRGKEPKVHQSVKVPCTQTNLTANRHVLQNGLVTQMW
jgi:hypothetical protein